MTLLVADRVLPQVSRSPRMTPSTNDHRWVPEMGSRDLHIYYRMAFPPAKWKRRQYCELYLDVVPNGNLVRKYET
jgi:hypothetical protein